jgi:hypothetical protein
VLRRPIETTILSMQISAMDRDIMFGRNKWELGASAPHLLVQDVVCTGGHPSAPYTPALVRRASNRGSAIRNQRNSLKEKDKTNSNRRFSAYCRTLSRSLRFAWHSWLRAFPSLQLPLSRVQKAKKRLIATVPDSKFGPIPCESMTSHFSNRNKTSISSARQVRLPQGTQRKLCPASLKKSRFLAMLYSRLIGAGADELIPEAREECKLP